jgi:hypothetical protein
MKKFIYTFSFLFFLTFAVKSQTATDFTANLCNGKSLHLFNELDNGKVIVLFFEMGCGSCISAGTNMESKYATMDTNRVKCFYLDYNTGSTCSDVETWKTSNGLTFPSIPDAYSIMKPYGSGMPLILIVGGADHKVFYKGNWNATKIQTAITAATDAALSVNTPSAEMSKINVFPNPASNASSITFTLNQHSQVLIELYDMTGKQIRTFSNQEYAAGELSFPINTSCLSNGNYIISVKAGNSIAKLPLTIQ